MTRTSGERGQAAIIGIVLIVGIVAVGSLAILLAGTTATDETRDRTQNERVKQAFIELDRNLDSVAQSDDGIRVTTLDLPGESEAAIRQENVGSITINRTNLTDTRTIVVKDIGAIVYENEGTKFAYQGGGVFRGTGNQTRVISAPNIVYNTNDGDEPTLTLPITELQGQERLTDGEIRLRKSQTVSPLNDVSTIENQLVEIKITSEYYVGWGRYFENRYDNAVVNYDHGDDTVTILLGKREIDGNFDAAISVGGNINMGPSAGSISGNATAGGTINSGGGPGPGPGPGTGESCSDPENTCGDSPNLAPLDPVINSKIATAESSYPDVSTTTENGGTLTAGEYYTDGFHLNKETLELDLSNGNVTLVVNGSIGVSSGGQIKVVHADQNATCCYARLYVGGGTNNEAGDIGMANGGEKTAIYEDDTDSDPENNASRLQVYGTSEMHFAVGQNGNFHGVVYAPRDGDEANGDNAAVEGGDQYFSTSNSVPSSATASCGSGALAGSAPYDVCLGTGTGSVDGGLIGFNDIGMMAGGGISYDDSLETIEPTLGYGGVVPPPVTFVHVAVNKVCVGTDPCEGDSNADPVVSSVSAADGTVTEGGNTESLSASANDPDGTVSSYSWSVASGPGSVSGSGSSVTYTSPASVASDQSVTVEVAVTDNDSATTTDTVSVTVTDTPDNDPPSIDSTSSPSSVDEDASGSLSASASDPEGDSLTYSWSVTSGPGSISGSGPSVTYDAPSSVSSDQSVTVEVTVDDGNGNSDSATTSFTVDNNEPPTISSTSSPSKVDEGSSGTLSVSASDTEGDALSYSWTITSGPGSLSGSGDSVTYDAPASLSSDQTVDVEVTVSDANGSDTATLSFVANDTDGGNSQPVISSTSGPSSVREGDSAGLSASASDPDGDSLTYTWTVTSGPGSISGSGDSVTYDAPANVASDQSVTVEVTVDDGNGGTDTATRSFTVEDNDPPTISSTSSPSTVEEGSSGTLSASASDPNGDSLTYTWTVTSGPGSISGSGDSVTYDAPANVASDRSVTVEVTVDDGNGGSDTATLSLTVDDNDEPVITGTSSPSTVDEGSSASLSVSATDPEGDSMSYSWTVTSGPGSISGSGSSVTYDAPANVASDQSVTVEMTVSDGQGGSNTTTMGFTVKNTGTPLSANLAITQTKSGGFSEYELDASGSSPAGDIEEYRWDFDGDGSVDRTTTSATTKVTCGNPGQDYNSCGSLSTATVTVVDVEDSRTDSASESY